MRSLGIRNVGDHIAKIIARSVTSLENLYNMQIEDLKEIYEVGSEVAESVYSFFHNSETKAIIDEMKNAGVTIENEVYKNEGKDNIIEKIFVFTGALQNFSRKEAEDMVERYGGKVSSSVSKKTDYLVAGFSGGAKLEKAGKLGVNIISEDEFLTMIGKAK